MSRLRELLARQPAVVLDGGLATELEFRGHDLSDRLWSARLLLEDPAAISAVHRSFLWAGADVVTSATYQASLPALRDRGLDESTAEWLLADAVRRASRARDRFWAQLGRGAARRRCRPLVAASVGSYGAFLSDGSEYRGSYGRSVGELIDFHRRRLSVLHAALEPGDLVLFETIPSFEEVQAIAVLLDTVGVESAWLSLSLRDALHLADGTALDDVVRWLHGTPGLEAVGVNCIAPRIALDAVRSVSHAGSWPVIAYPNAGEGWVGGAWAGSREGPESFAASARAWWEAGARIIGGCCRTSPAHVRTLRNVLIG